MYSELIRPWIRKSPNIFSISKEDLITFVRKSLQFINICWNLIMRRTAFKSGRYKLMLVTALRVGVTWGIKTQIQLNFMQLPSSGHILNYKFDLPISSWTKKKSMRSASTRYIVRVAICNCPVTIICPLMWSKEKLKLKQVYSL